MLIRKESLQKKKKKKKLEKFENAALVLRFLRSALIRHANGAFKERSPSKNLQTPVFRFPVDGNICSKTAAFRSDRGHHYNHVISLTEFPSNTILK